mmetsp:Transcript_31110/g.81525  ORF Transcript_31110/g.81525 Transcript_31110/m.81525 type:complete len:579 (+) Transcript_31110:88-1824(+)
MPKPTMQELARLKRLERSAGVVQRGLTRPAVNQAILAAGLPHLQRTHYHDVVEERSAQQRCGYPLCRNELAVAENDRGPKYRIDRSKKMVFDATEQRNFCCRQCCAASHHMANQISELPLGLRTASAFKPAKLSFLPHGRPSKADARPKRNGTGTGIASAAPTGPNPPSVQPSMGHGEPTSDPLAAAALTVAERFRGPGGGVPPTPPQPPGVAEGGNAHARVEGYEPGTVHAVQRELEAAGKKGEANILAGATPKRQSPWVPLAPTAGSATATAAATVGGGADGRPDPWDGFEVALAEAQRLEREAELHQRQRRQEALRLSLLGSTDADTDTGTGTATPATGSPAALGAAAVAVATATAAAHPPSTATAAEEEPKEPTYTRLHRTVASWRTAATIELLARGGDQPWERRVAKLTGDGVAEAAVGSGAQFAVADDGGEVEVEVAGPRLPPVDSRSQFRVRQGVLATQLGASLPTMLSFLELPPHAVQRELAALVATLELHMNSVTFSPTEWLVLTTVLLVALAPNVTELATAWSAVGAAHPGVPVPPTKLEMWLTQLGIDAFGFSKLVNSLTTADDAPP